MTLGVPSSTSSTKRPIYIRARAKNFIPEKRKKAEN